ncbi:MAG: hypothetical protein JG770_1465 [Mahella sp.]|nr:hypothetical protein [Mahella sp.]
MNQNPTNLLVGVCQTIFKGSVERLLNMWDPLFTIVL